MSIPSTSAFALQSGYTEQSAIHLAISSMNPSIPLPRKSWSSLQGPVAILWDMENCPVPSGVRPEDVAGNIRMALRVHPVIDGVVTLFSAYGDFNAFPRRLREGCQRTGVKLVDVPNGRKDAADKAILVDMFLFALDNPPPSSIMLISGDVDFSPALHILGQRGYTVILVIPARVGVSSALSNAGRFLWDWPSVARGEGYVPPARAFVPSRLSPAEIGGVLMRHESSESVEDQNEEESIVYMGVSKRCNNAIVQCGSDDIPAGNRSFVDQNDLTLVQPGDLNGLKGQLVKLLELSGGSLRLKRLTAEYKKLYGRNLCVSEYGSKKLASLLEKITDAIGVNGKGKKRFVSLHNSNSIPVGPPVILARKDIMEGKKAPEDSNDKVITGAGSSDDERVVVGENGNTEGGNEFDLEKTDRSQFIERNLDKFKCELQEILVSYSCRLSLCCLEVVYQQKYKRKLDYLSLGVNRLEELMEKVRDVVDLVVLQEDPVSRRKFLVAVSG